MTPETDDPKQDVRLIVWDLPLRLFHWGLAATVIISVVSVNMGRMDIHERSGLTVLALVAFRIIWGSPAVTMQGLQILSAHRSP